jgi:hypothetical protein
VGSNNSTFTLTAFYARDIVEHTRKAKYFSVTLYAGFQIQGSVNICEYDLSVQKHDHISKNHEGMQEEYGYNYNHSGTRWR